MLILDQVGFDYDEEGEYQLAHSGVPYSWAYTETRFHLPHQFFFWLDIFLLYENGGDYQLVQQELPVHGHTPKHNSAYSNLFTKLE